MWIKCVVLTSRIYNEFSKIAANASGQIGEVVGVSTGVYHKIDNSLKSVIIGFEAFDLDELVKQASITKGGFQEEIITKLLNSSIYTKIIEGEIKIK